MNKVRLAPAVTVALAIGLTRVGGCDREPDAASDASPASAPAPARKSARSEIAAIAITDVDAKVIAIVAEQMGVKPSEVTTRTHLKRDLKADELDHVELVMELEDTFGVSIDDGDADKLQTVGDFIQYVRARQKKAP